jgi:polar amino acid transport system substrate-binding protein
MDLKSNLRRLAFGAMLALGFAQAAIAADPPAPGASATIDAIKQRGELRAGVAVALPWLGFDPSTNNYFGASYDLGKAIAEQLGVKLTLVGSGWDVIVAGIQGNQFDLILAPLLATEKRMAVVDFVNYSSGGTCYAVKPNSALSTLEDLNDPSVTIGTFTGTGNDHGVRAKYTKAKIDSVVQTAGGGQRIEDVLTGRITAAAFDSPIALLIAQEFPQLKIIPGGPENCVNAPDVPFPIGMAFAKGDAAFQTFLEAVVKERQTSINRLIVKYSDPQFMKQ